MNFFHKNFLFFREIPKMAFLPTTRQFYFEMPDGEKIPSHDSLIFLSGFLQDFVEVDPENTDPVGIPTGKHMGKDEIELLNKFLEHLDANHHEAIVENLVSKECWMHFIVSKFYFLFSWSLDCIGADFFS